MENIDAKVIFDQKLLIFVSKTLELKFNWLIFIHWSIFNQNLNFLIKYYLFYTKIRGILQKGVIKYHFRFKKNSFSIWRISISPFFYSKNTFLRMENLRTELWNIIFDLKTF